MPLLLRIMLALLLLVVAGFCAFGFLASFEPSPGALKWRIGYALVGTISLIGIAWVMVARRSPR